MKSDDKDQVHLIISDNGVGIEPQELENIFKPFYKIWTNTKGAGLGLSIIENVVTQKMNGNISCESTLNEGTTFKIVIPLED